MGAAPDTVRIRLDGPVECGNGKATTTPELARIRHKGAVPSGQVVPVWECLSQIRLQIAVEDSLKGLQIWMHSEHGGQINRGEAATD